MIQINKSVNRFRFTGRIDHFRLSRCSCCRLKFDQSQLQIFKLKYYCPYCLPGVKLAHDVIDKLRRKDV